MCVCVCVCVRACGVVHLCAGLLYHNDDATVMVRKIFGAGDHRDNGWWVEWLRVLNQNLTIIIRCLIRSNTHIYIIIFIINITVIMN